MQTVKYFDKHLIEKAGQLYKNGKTYAEIAQFVFEKCGRRPKHGTVNSWARKKWGIRRTYFQYNKPNLFGDIQNNEDAYWLGFILADGCVRVDGDGRYRFSIRLAIKDKEHLEKFARFCDIDGNDIRVVKTSIKNFSTYLGVDYYFTNKKIVTNIMNHGIVPMKTSSQNLEINGIKPEFYKPFVRGFIDGDGYIGLRGKNARVQILCNISLEDQLLDMLNYVISENPIVTCKKSISKDGNTVSLEFSAATSRLIAKIYDNGEIALERKKKIALDILRI